MDIQGILECFRKDRVKQLEAHETSKLQLQLRFEWALEKPFSSSKNLVDSSEQVRKL